MVLRHAEFLQAVGERIRQTRYARGVSMKIAHEIRANYGVKLDPSYLSRIERGKTEIPLRTLLAISDYFGLRPGYLLDIKSTEKPEGTEYIFVDPQLVQYLIRLKEALGEEQAREQLQGLLGNVLSIIDCIMPNAARLQTSRATTKNSSERPASPKDA